MLREKLLDLYIEEQRGMLQNWFIDKNGPRNRKQRATDAGLRTETEYKNFYQIKTIKEMQRRKTIF